MTTTKTKKAPKTSPSVITDLDILAVATSRSALEQAETALAAAKKANADAEANLKAKLQGDHTFEGSCRAQLNTSSTTVPGKFSPSYKELYVGHMMGEHGYDQERLDEVLREAYPVTNKVVVTTELVVTIQ